MIRWQRLSYQEEDLSLSQASGCDLIKVACLLLWSPPVPFPRKRHFHFKKVERSEVSPDVQLKLTFL